MENPQAVYLDFNATTPVDQHVLEIMLPYFTEHFANAASTTHFPGRAAAAAVDFARKQVSMLVGCESEELVFTSGATESINLAIKGAAVILQNKGKHIISWTTEHPAVLEVLSKLSRLGFEITLLPVDRQGHADLDLYKSALRRDTILTCMMLANNETGVIQPVKEFATVARENNSLFFCDATQAAGKIRVDINDLGVDMMCISAHKMYGPKGTGALFVRRKNPRVYLDALIDGGGHEKGLRSGTLNVPGIVGFGAAAKIAKERYWDDSSRLSHLRSLLEQQLTDNGLGYVNGDIRNRLPNTTNICFPGIQASRIISALPFLSVATGSACSSALPRPSHVLKAMGLTDAEAYSSIRFSLGRPTTELEITQVVEGILKWINSNNK